jgi:hypothetical protein
LFLAFCGSPNTNCPLERLLPISSQYPMPLEPPVHLAMMARAARVSTHPITISGRRLGSPYPSDEAARVRELSAHGMAFQLKPQKRLIRVTKTIPLFNPISL